MKITYDPAKNERNIRERGLSFDRANELAWDSAIIWEDDRRDYGEIRKIASGFLDNRLHMLVYTERGGTVHVISFRKANVKEEKRYGEEKEARS